MDWVIEAIKDELKDRNETPKDESKKTEDINEEDEDEEEEDDPYGETISLLAIAYRDIPEVGVEDWGKDNELYFCLDTRKVLSYLEEYEVEIPKKLYDDASSDDWSNGVDDYLTEFLGVDTEIAEDDNSYNWGSRLTHDINLSIYDTDDCCYVKMSVHREGDVRGNYTVDFLLRFDTREDYYEAMMDAQVSCANQLDFEGKQYWIEPHIYDEHVDISTDGEEWTDVYCEDLDQFKEIISGSSEE